MHKLKNVPFEFKNEVVNETTVLTLSGVVGKPYPWEEESDTINEKLIENALSDVDGDIVIRLNSQGGDVFEGISICNYLKSLPNKVTIEVTALAASAASIICMGADKVIMDEGSQMMIHEASTIAWGNKSDIQKTLNALETIDKSLISIYQSKTGIDDETLNNLLNAETWFTAQEAVEQGFADEIKANVVEEETTDDIVDEINDADSELKLGESEKIILDGNTTIDANLIKKLYEKVIENEESKPNLLKNFLGGIK